jgi:hypothetical protein
MRAIPYKQAIEWMIANDDTEFLDLEDGCLSVTGSLVADIYGKQDGEVWEDLWKLRNKRAKAKGVVK